jgi:two-component system, NtrC family, sensor kinase
MNSSSDWYNNRILIIDDNPSIHDDIRKILTSAAAQNVTLEQEKAAVLGELAEVREVTLFKIDSALQGNEGLELVQQAVASGQPYALVFVDMRMPPGWDGITTLAQLWKIDPNLQGVICTAYSDYSWEEIVQKIGKSANMVILKKPFDNIEVLQLAHALAEKWRLNHEVNVKLTDLDRLVQQRTAELETANAQLKREIADRMAMENALRQAQKMEAIGQLAAGVAHDFNNILTVIEGHASLLIDSPKTTDAHESLHEIRNSADRAASLVRQLLAFSRKQMIRPTALDLGQVVKRLGDMLRRVLGEQIILRIHTAEKLPAVEADLRMMEQVVINLALNARDAMPSGGAMLISTTVEEITADSARLNPEGRPGHFVSLTVADTGCGIAPEIVSHIFEPFFTTKQTGKGTGLGLASAYGIVKQHGGWIEVQSELNRGTTFRVLLPITTNSLPVEPAVSDPIKGGNETVLVVEDEPSVRRLATDILKRYGYRVFEAESGRQALDLFQKHVDDIQVLLTDMVMPGGISGQELADRLRQENASLKVIYMTGYSPSIAGSGTKSFEEINLLTKPYSGSILLRAVRNCLDKPATPKPRAATQSDAGSE